MIKLIETCFFGFLEVKVLGENGLDGWRVVWSVLISLF